MSNRQIASALGISRNTVNSYFKTFKEHQLSIEDLEGLTETDLADLFPKADYKDSTRYEQLIKCFPYFQKELNKPGCTLQVLWHEYLSKHADGYRYTQFVTYYNQWSNAKNGSGILIHKAAEKLYVDFAGKKLSYVDRSTGEVKGAEVFVAILPCSQYTYVQAVESQKREDFISCLNGCLQWLGGVPKAIVSDNLKAAVSKGHKYAPVINKTLKSLALHYKCVIDPTRPYHPQDKALVEGAVKLVYQRIYYPLSKHTFFSLKELNDAIAEQLISYNDKYCFQTSRVTRKQRFQEIEKEFLAPLPSSPYLIKNYKRAKVQKIGHVFLSEDRNYYSVPHRYIGQHVEVQYDACNVEVFFNKERVASHRRSYKAGGYSTVKEHLPSSHQAYNDWNPEYFIQKAEKVGRYTCDYITRLISQYNYPELAYKQAQGILSFLKAYSAERLESACKRALQYHKASYKTIDRILKNNLDQEANFTCNLQSNTPDHDNIRGASNYI
ncbi:IS21 family transposase [Cytophagaceae bacterium ABcell3]|nr:IS21 family transposase [Cytophagaceae bacterium ABcell3]